jgi:hypothetical protein
LPAASADFRAANTPPGGKYAIAQSRVARQRRPYGASTMSRWGRSLPHLSAAIGTLTVFLGASTLTFAGGRAWLVDPVDGLRHGPGVANHPVNVVPSPAVSIPAGWPLASDGSITCMTCHTELGALADGGNRHLRDFDLATDNTIQFCAKCHDSGTQRTARGMHWMVVGVAHVKPGGNGAKRNPGSLDAGSRRCMECHDGVTARESATANAWHRGPGSIGDHRRNHPVGVPYPTGFSRKGAGPFRPTNALPPKVRLCEGRVSCISCHDLYAPDRSKLSVTIESSALCFTCHDMD